MNAVTTNKLQGLCQSIPLLEKRAAAFIAMESCHQIRMSHQICVQNWHIVCGHQAATNRSQVPPTDIAAIG